MGICRDTTKLKRTDIKDGFFDVVTQKTHDGLRIELNDHAQAILDKYKNDNIKGDLALPVISNVKMNAQLEVMGQVCGIDEPTRIVYFQGHERHEQVFPKNKKIRVHPKLKKPGDEPGFNIVPRAMQGAFATMWCKDTAFFRKSALIRQESF